LFAATSLRREANRLEELLRQSRAVAERFVETHRV
jgi:hypothetical protein